MRQAFLWGLAWGAGASVAVGLAIAVTHALGGILLDGPYRNDLEAP